MIMVRGIGVALRFDSNSAAIAERLAIQPDQARVAKMAGIINLYSKLITVDFHADSIRRAKAKDTPNIFTINAKMMIKTSIGN